MAEALAGKEGVRVSKLIKKTELRMTGLDDSIIPADVAEAIAHVGACTVVNTKVGPI